MKAAFNLLAKKMQNTYPYEWDDYKNTYFVIITSYARARARTMVNLLKAMYTSHTHDVIVVLY